MYRRMCPLLSTPTDVRDIDILRVGAGGRVNVPHFVRLALPPAIFIRAEMAAGAEARSIGRTETGLAIAN